MVGFIHVFHFSRAPFGGVTHYSRPCSLPNRLQTRGADTAVMADDGHIEINRSRGHHAVRHVRDLGARYLPHHLNDSSGKHGLCEKMLGVGQG
jgi:hypothetical protein